MLGNIISLLSSLSNIPMRNQETISCYLLFLMITMKKHSYIAASNIFMEDPTLFSKMLNNPNIYIY